MNSKDTYWKGTITELLNNREEKQRQFRESPDRVKFVTKLEKVYVYLSMHGNWAYSIDELSDIRKMDRKTVKHIVKLLAKIGAVEVKIATGVKYYIFKQEIDVLKIYKEDLVKKYTEWRMRPEEIAEDMKRKGLENVGENSAS